MDTLSSNMIKIGITENCIYAMFSAFGFRVLGFRALDFLGLGVLGLSSGKYPNTGPAHVFEHVE